MSLTSKLFVPNKNTLPHVQQLGDEHNPYPPITEESESLFIKAMREIVHWHRQNNAYYEKLCQEEKFDFDSQVKSRDDLIKIPHLWAHFFKTHELVSIPKENQFLHLTSSGTTGQKSQMYFDEWTIKVAQRMIDFIFNFYGWNTPNVKVNYILFSYQTQNDSKLGTAYTDNFLCKYAQAQEVFTSLRLTGDNGHEFDAFGTVEKFIAFAKAGIPVRIFGFPAFFYFALMRMKKLNMPPVKFHPESLVFLGGGWKGHADKEIDKMELYQLANEMLGIPLHRLRDGFGSVEHCIPYIECSEHQFHIPTWSKVFIRDVKTLTQKTYEEPGFLHFISPYITSAPAHSIIMGDLASLHQGKTCKCDLTTDYFKILGRAGLSKNKSCAISASELLKGRKS